MCRTLAEGGPCYAHAHERLRNQEKAYDNSLEQEARKAGVPLDKTFIINGMLDYDEEVVQEKKNYQAKIDDAKAKMLTSHEEALQAKQEYNKDNAISNNNIENLKNNINKRIDSISRKIEKPDKPVIPDFREYPDKENLTDTYAYMTSILSQKNFEQDQLTSQRESFDKAVETKVVNGSFELQKLRRKARLRGIENVFTVTREDDEQKEYNKALDTKLKELGVGRYSKEKMYEKEEANIKKYDEEYSSALTSYQVETAKFQEYLRTTKEFKDLPSREQGFNITEATYALKLQVKENFNYNTNGNPAFDYSRNKVKHKIRQFHEAKDKYVAVVNNKPSDKTRQEHYDKVTKAAPLDLDKKKKFEKDVFLNSPNGKELSSRLNSSRKQVVLTSTYRGNIKKRIARMDEKDPEKPKLVQHYSELEAAYAAQVENAKKRNEQRSKV